MSQLIPFEKRLIGTEFRMRCSGSASGNTCTRTIWLAQYCGENGIPVYEISPHGQQWGKENTYPANEMHVTLASWLKRRTAQAPLRSEP